MNRVLKAIERASFLGMMVTIVFLSTMASMCDDNDDNGSDTDNTALNAAIKLGTWRITSFIDDDKDETSDYGGYSFTFIDGGSATAIKNSAVISGSWSSASSSSGIVVLYLDFGSVSPLDELDEDWKVHSQTDTKIILQNVSGGDGHTDSLIFEKN